MKNNKLIEWVFKHEDEIRKAVDEYKSDGCGDRSKGTGRRGISRPVETEVCRRLSEIQVVEVVTEGEPSFMLRRPEAWIRLIDKVRDKYKGTVYARIYELKYRAPRQKLKGSSRQQEKIHDRIGLSRAGYYLLSNELMSYAEGAASMAGLT